MYYNDSDIFKHIFKKDEFVGGFVYRFKGKQTNHNKYNDVTVKCISKLYPVIKHNKKM